MENYYVKYNLNRSELDIELYQTKKHKDYIISHAFNLSELRQIVKILDSESNKNNKSNNESNARLTDELNNELVEEDTKSEVSCKSTFGLHDPNEVYIHRTLTELYILVSKDILTVGVGYGGPRIQIKVSPYLHSVFKKSIIKLGSIDIYKILHYIYEKDGELIIKIYSKGSRVIRGKFSKDNIDKILSELSQNGYYHINHTHCLVKPVVKISSELIDNNNSLITITMSNLLENILKTAFKSNYNSNYNYDDDSDCWC